jgi:hypothetical protein
LADNVAITAGSGISVGADEVGGVQYQRTKLVWGPDGTVNDADVASGKPLPVQLRTALGTAIGTLEDTASASADPLIPIAVVRTATPANSSGTDGDYEPLQIADGKLWVRGQTQALIAATQFARPADTTAYASGDLVANSTTAGSVAALQFATAARVSGGTGDVIAARITKSTNSVTNAAFRLHLFTVIPTFTSAGDNSALSTVVVAAAKGYVGYIDITAMTGFSDVAWGTGAPDSARQKLPFIAVAQILYGFLEARGAYTPGNAETFDVSIMVKQD